MSVFIPLRMQKLPRDPQGRVVPAIVERDASGNPLFARLNDKAMRRCLNDDLCQICAQPLMRRRWLVGGPQRAFAPHDFYTDLPGHLECIEYSLRTCPYLSVPNYLRKVELVLPVHEGVAAVRSDDRRRPSPSFLACVGTIGRVSPDLVLHVTPTGLCDRMQIWRHGKMIAEGGLEFIARLAAMGAPTNQSDAVALLGKAFSIVLDPREITAPAPDESPVMGDFRFLVSIEVGDACVGHAYIKCRTRPEENLQHYTFGLINQLQTHGFTTCRSEGVLTAKVDGDAVEKILAAANRDIARSLTEYESASLEHSHFSILIMSERDPINLRLMALHCSATKTRRETRHHNR
jgi:hypothetical protein